MLGDPPLFVAMSLAAFAVLFGTRHIDATEHQHGLMLAVAVESIVKLVAFVAVGIFVTFVMFDGPFALLAKALERARHGGGADRATPTLGSMAAMTLLSFFAIVLLPRQFYVTVVENKNDAEIRRAAWLFPLYLVLINLFVMPVAIAGMLTFAPGTVDSDMYVLALPIAAGSEILRACGLHRRPVGGGRHGDRRVGRARHHGVERHRGAVRAHRRRDATNVGTHLLTVRRIAIFAVLLFAYLYYRSRRRSPARRHRADGVCRHRAARAGVLRRAGVAARHRARRSRRHDRPASWCGPIRCCCRASPTPRRGALPLLADGPFGIGAAAAAGACSGSTCRRWSMAWLWSLSLNLARLCGGFADPPARRDRTHAGGHLRARRPRARRRASGCGDRP